MLASYWKLVLDADIALLAGKSAAVLSPFVLSPAGLGNGGLGSPSLHAVRVRCLQTCLWSGDIGCLGNPVRLSIASVSEKGLKLR